jgi:hypothetical protein
MAGNELPQLRDVADDRSAFVDATLDRFQDTGLQRRQVELLRKTMRHHAIGPGAYEIEQAIDDHAERTDDQQAVERIVTLARDRPLIDLDHEDRSDQGRKIQEKAHGARKNKPAQEHFPRGLQEEHGVGLLVVHEHKQSLLATLYVGLKAASTPIIGGGPRGLQLPLIRPNCRQSIQSARLRQPGFMRSCGIWVTWLKISFDTYFSVCLTYLQILLDSNCQRISRALIAA